MRRIPPLLVRPAAAALLVLLAGPPAGAQEDPAAAPSTAAGRLVVMGEGRVAAAPDLATVVLGVEAEAAEASEALAAASEAAAALMEALHGAGVAEADLQTARLRLDPRHGEDGRPAGYVATNLLEARLRGADALGAALDAASAAGVNRIDGIRFAVAEPEAALAEARRLAVADARAAAETLAEAAGLSLGPVLRIEQGGGGGGPAPVDMMVRAEAMAVPVAPGEVETAARVRMVFALEGADGG